MAVRYYSSETKQCYDSFVEAQVADIQAKAKARKYDALAIESCIKSFDSTKRSYLNVLNAAQKDYRRAKQSAVNYLKRHGASKEALSIIENDGITVSVTVAH